MGGVLVVHNRYVSTSPSGENDVVDEEITLLRTAGRTVHTYIRSSDEITASSRMSKVALATSPTYAHKASQELGRIIDLHRPDVLHLHNPFPLISPWVVRLASAKGVPVVQTVHNYRHVCVAGSLFREGRVCEDCVGKAVGWPAIAHGCYRGSRVQSVPMVLSQAVHRSTWRHVDRFLALTTFMAHRLTAMGIDPERVAVRPTATGDPGEPGEGGPGLVYVGRLTEEKGLKLLLDAWVASGLGHTRTLTIIGDGPMLRRCQQVAAVSPGIEAAGRLSPAEVAMRIRGAGALVSPSLWYEGFPRVVVEALSHGTPVLATRIGSLTEIVDPDVGWTVEATTEALATGLQVAASDGNTRRQAARARYVERYRPEVTLAQLLAVYDEVSRAPLS